MKFIACLITYVLEFSILSFYTYITFSIKATLKSKLAIIGALVIWLSFIFNIVYTGMLGWNLTPSSDLESLLDSICTLFLFIGAIIWFIGIKSSKTK